MAKTVEITTPDHVQLELELAGLGSRFLACVIDYLIIAFTMFVMVVLFLALLGGGSLLDFDYTAAASSALFYLVVFVIIWGYSVAWEGLARGQTPGKRIVGIRVLRDNGQAIGLRAAAIRNLVRAADVLPPPCYFVGAATVLFSKTSQRLGDMAAGTLVVHERFDMGLSSRVGAAWVARIERGQSRHGLTLPKGQISAHQLDLLEQFLDRQEALIPAIRERIAWQIVEPLLPLLDESTADVNLSSLPASERTRHCIRVMEFLIKLAEQESSASARAPRQSTRGPLF